MITIWGSPRPWNWKQRGPDNSILGERGCRGRLAVHPESEFIMRTALPWHSLNVNHLRGLFGLGSLVYHNNNACTEGNNIEPQYLRIGTGDRALCAHCARLNAIGR